MSRCISPMIFYRRLPPWVKSDPGGRHPLTRNRADAYCQPDPVPIQVPCGKCITCRQTSARMWAIRCSHEARLHDYTSFVTLTYDDAHLGPGGSLEKRELQLFIKRLRKAIYPILIRYYACGEYGLETKRPHYHLLIYGYDFKDKIPYSVDGDSVLCISELLSSLWTYGFSTVAEATLGSIYYVAGYVTKKYSMTDDDYADREKVFSVMSLRPGIGSGFYDKYSSDMYSYDVMYQDHKPIGKPPRYYDKLHERLHPDEMKTIKDTRRAHSQSTYDDARRTEQRAEYHELQSKRGHRPYEGT